MGTDNDPGIDSILLHSDDPSLRILGYGLRENSFHYDDLVDGARLNGETPIDDSLTALERRGHVTRNGDGSYHIPRDRFNGSRARNNALELVRERTDDATVYRHVTAALDSVDGDAAVPAAYLDATFPDREWRVELSPFVMAHALHRPTYYARENLPPVVPHGAAESDLEYPVEVYELGDPIYRRAAEEIITATGATEVSGPLTTD
ncbi:MAG: hypothetical protein SVY41_01505 [Candidatus Nanohaloarchaea archaeon]|nr:hypothetical protein [Candidatus Nanohaloarchaea archaeon]